VLGALFDARNGNRGWAHSLAEARATRPSPTPLDLDLGLLAVVESAPAEPADATAEPAADHLARAEEASAAGRTEDAGLAYAAAAAAALDAGLLVDGGFALAEAARCAQVLGDDETADELYDRAVAVLRAGGTDPVLVVPVVVAWAPAAVATGHGTQLVEAADALALLVGSTEVPAATPEGVALAERRHTERRRAAADLDDTTARVLGSVGPTDPAVDRAVRAAEAYAELGATGDAGHAYLLAGRLLDGPGSTDDAIRYLESAVDGFSRARDGALRAAALSDLEAVLRRTGQVTRADEVLARLTEPG
jgi:tetratricopeptide (TPR) repeat protein